MKSRRCWNFTRLPGAEKHLLFAVLEAILVILVTKGERLDKKPWPTEEEEEEVEKRSLWHGEGKKERTVMLWNEPEGP